MHGTTIRFSFSPYWSRSPKKYIILSLGMRREIIYGQIATIDRMTVRLTFSQEVYYRRKTNTYVNLRNPTYRDLRQQFTDPILTMSRDKSPSLEINRTQREMRALAAPSVHDSIFKLLMHFFAVAFLTSGDRRGATDKRFFSI